MTIIQRILTVLFTIGLAASSLHAVDFAHDVMPVLKEHCAKCHTGKKKKGGLAMNTRAELLAGGENGDVVIPGKASKSLMIELIESLDDLEYMPPKGDRVPPKDLAILKKWINEGLPWDASITLGKSAWEPPLKPRTVTLPPATNGRTHPIDRILDASLAKRKQTTPSRSSDAAFLRRATLDSVGLLPTPEALQSYLIDKAPNKQSRYIDSLLANDIAYADHWLSTWNDLLRNDYTGTGFITGGRNQITNWLYKSLQENKPYDVFVRELIAPPNKDSAGFINGIKWRGDVNASQTREIQFSQNISQVFLGINMKCASCHDSFIDRWKLAEAYNLAAIYSEKPLELNRCDKPTGVMATPKWIFPELGDIDPKAPKNERLKQLAALMTHPENGRFTRTIVNRIWERLMGRGIVHPVDAMDSKPWNEDLLDYLAVRFADDGYDLRKFIRFVMTSQAYQSRSVILKKEPGEDYVYHGPIAKRMTAEQFLDTIWQVTATNPKNPTAKVNRILKPQSALKEAQKREKPKIVIKKALYGVKGNASKQINLTQKIQQQVDRGNFTFNASYKFAGKDPARGVHKTLEIEYLLNGKLIKSSLKEGTQFNFVSVHPKGKGPSAAVRAALVKNDFLMRSLGRPNRDQVVTSRPNELTTLQAIDLANGDTLANYLQSGAKHLISQKKSSQDLSTWLYRYTLSRSPTAAELSILTAIAGKDQNPISVEDLLWLVFMQPEFQIIR
jgi:hypothetical protein